MAPVPAPVPLLADGDVRLRRHLDSDIDGVVEQCRDPLSRRWTTVPLEYTRDDARRFVREVMPGGWLADQEWGFAVEVDGRYAGTVSLRNEGAGRAEIAFGTHPWVRGTGAVTRALRLLLDWGFADRELESVVWFAHVGNWASRKTAWRLGFTFAGTLRRRLAQRGELRDAWAATLLREDPREPRTRWLEVPVLHGDRVLLRRPREDDVPRIVAACQDPEAQRWLGGLPSPYAGSDARDWLAEIAEGAATGRMVTWAVADAADDRFLGSLGIFDVDPDSGAEVGYLTHPEARGRGLTAEACGLAVRYALGDLGLPKVRAAAAAGNLASRRVLEACGFRSWGVERRAVRVRDGWADAVRYDVIAASPG